MGYSLTKHRHDGPRRKLIRDKRAFQILQTLNSYLAKLT